MRDHRAPLLWTLAAGLLLSGAAGCETSPGEEYQPLTPSQAEQIEQDRQARAAEQSENEITDTTSNSSPLVLAAAQTVAATLRSYSASPPIDSDVPGGQPDATGTVDVRPAAGPPAKTGTSEPAAADSPVTIAAERAARAVQGEPIVRTIELLVPERSFTVEGPDDAIRISYDDFDLLKVLNMEPVPTNAVDHFPKWLADLDGKRVRVRGFMYPTFQETDIPGFVLARDNQICCFGRNPKIYDLVEVTLADGVTTDYIQGRPFDVVGMFHIRPEADGDELWQLYQLDDAIVVDE